MLYLFGQMLQYSKKSLKIESKSKQMITNAGRDVDRKEPSILPLRM